MQCACTILSSVDCPLYNIFPHYNVKCTNLEKKGGGLIGHEIFVLICATKLSETFLILRTTEQDMSNNVYWCSCKVHLILYYFRES
jgi:hypothetical protein